MTIIYGVLISRYEFDFTFKHFTFGPIPFKYQLRHCYRLTIINLDCKTVYSYNDLLENC